MDDGKTTSDKIEGALFGLRKGMSFECRLPLTAIHAAQGSVLRIRFSLWRDRLPLDQLLIAPHAPVFPMFDGTNIDDVMLADDDFARLSPRLG